MNRRTFLYGLTLGTLAAPLAVEAQPAGKVFRVASLGAGAPELLRQSLSDVGYIEGRNLVIEWRDAEGKTERFEAIAAAPVLVHERVLDLLVAERRVDVAAVEATLRSYRLLA